MSLDNYIPITYKIKKALERVSGDTVTAKAKTLSLPEHYLRRSLSVRSISPKAAEQVSTALGREIDELYFR